jgi:hypothetical protein
MAINTQKLLPSSKKISSSSLSLRGSFGSSLVKKSASVGAIEKLSKIKSSENVSIIQKSLIDVDALLKSVVSEEKQSEVQENIQKRKKKAEDRETKLEAPKEQRKFNFPKISIPGTSFLDRIKRFLFFTALGWLFTRFQSELPKLMGIVKIIAPIYSVVENVFKFILSSVVSFIERGYDTYDKFRSIVKSVGGEKAQEEFDKLSSKLNEYINYVLIGGMALTGAITTFARNARNYKPPKPATTSGGSGGRPRVTTSGGGAASRPDVRNPLRQRPTVTTGSGGARAIAGKQATRQLLRVAKGTLSRLPILGGLVEFGLSWALGDPVGKAAFRGVGTLLLGAVGSLIMPGFGTFAGGYLGAELAGKLYDVLFGNKQPSSVQRNSRGGKIKRYAKGGQVVGGRGRTLKTVKSTIPRFPPQQLSPGKDVGGKSKIKKLYPDPGKPMTVAEWLASGASGTYQQYLDSKKRESRKPSPYQALTDVRNTLSTIPYGIGIAMSAAIDAAFGQNISSSTISSITNGIQQLLDYSTSGIQSGVLGGVGDVRKQIYGMRNGGIISNRTGGIVDRNSQINLKKIIGDEIKQKVSSALMSVQKQLMLSDKGQLGEDGDSLNPIPGDINVTSDSPDFWLLVTAALFENGNPGGGYQGAADVAQAIYNRVSLPGWPKSIRGVILQSGQFQPVRDYGGTSEWEKINSKDSAIAFAKKYKGYSGNIVEKIAAALLNKDIQDKARDFVGPRDNFRNVDYEKQNNHLDDSTEVTRHYHTFGFEPGGANIAKFKSGQLMPAQINKQTVTGRVEDISNITTAGYKPKSPGKFNVIQYITGDPSQRANYDLSGHGRPENYHDHIAFETEADKERAKAALRAAGIKIGSEYRPGDSGYHGKNLAIDVPGYQWGGSGTIGQKEYDGSSRVRSVLGLKGGGIIPKQNQRNDLKSLSSYPSYSAEGGFIIAIQPMIIERTVPVSVGNKGGTTAFIPSGSVNNTNIQSLSRG